MPHNKNLPYRQSKNERRNFLSGPALTRIRREQYEEKKTELGIDEILEHFQGFIQSLLYQEEICWKNL